MVKDFLVAVGKAACYFLLYLVTQFAATYMFILVDMVTVAAKNPIDFTDVDSFMDMYTQVANNALAYTDVIYIVSAIMTIGLLALFFHMRRKSLFSETWMRPFKVSSAWPIVLLSAASAAVICIGIGCIPWPQAAVSEYEQMVSTTVNEGWLSVISAVLFAPVLEEIIFRGLMFTRLCKGMPAAAAAILVATIFAFMHGTLIWACYAFVCGIMMLLIYVKYRSLYASILFHIVFNICGGYVIPALLSNAVSFELYILAPALLAALLLGYLIYKMPRSRIDLPVKSQGGADAA